MSHFIERLLFLCMCAKERKKWKKKIATDVPIRVFKL